MNIDKSHIDTNKSKKKRKLLIILCILIILILLLIIFNQSRSDKVSKNTQVTPVITHEPTSNISKDPIASQIITPTYYEIIDKITPTDISPTTLNPTTIKPTINISQSITPTKIQDAKVTLKPNISPILTQNVTPIIKITPTINIYPSNLVTSTITSSPTLTVRPIITPIVTATLTPTDTPSILPILTPTTGPDTNCNCMNVDGSEIILIDEPVYEEKQKLITPEKEEEKYLGTLYRCNRCDELYYSGYNEDKNTYKSYEDYYMHILLKCKKGFVTKEVYETIIIPAIYENINELVGYKFVDIYCKNHNNHNIRIMLEDNELFSELPINLTLNMWIYKDIKSYLEYEKSKIYLIKYK